LLFSAIDLLFPAILMVRPVHFSQVLVESQLPLPVLRVAAISKTPA